MTSTEPLVVPLDGSARLLNRAPTGSVWKSFCSRSVSFPFGVMLLLAVGSAVWIHSQASPLAASIAVAGSVVAIVSGVIATYQFCVSNAKRRLAGRAAEWETLEARLRVQLSEQTRREQQLLSEHARLKEESASLLRSKAELADELGRRKQAEQALSLQRQDLVRTKDVLELHVQARAEEMEKMQRRHELILDSAGEGICGMNTEGKIAFANPAAARILGRTVEKMVGRPFVEFFPSLPAAAATEPNGANPSPRCEVVLNRPDSSSFVLEYSRSPVREGRRTVGEVFLFKDISERKQTEETLARKATELARSNAELEQFAFVASHDLQEPLRKIQAFGDRLKARCEAVDLGEGRQYLERMQNAAARMRTLIDDLLTFSRVISRTEPFAQVDLNVVTREVLADLEVRIERSGATVEVGELPVLDADPMQMRQLLQNLIGNALKFHETGAKPVVKIAGKRMVKPADCTQTAFLRRAGISSDKKSFEEYWELTVMDNGIGFEEKYLDRIFAVFQRLHGRQEYEGTGIGLAVCRRIVDRHGGNLTAKSFPGKGATFIVTLPLQGEKLKNAK